MGKRLRLNIGCGENYRAGYVNIDTWPEVKADLRLDVCYLESAFKDVDEILAIHVIESFYRWEVGAVLSNWYRALKKGGKLIMEATHRELACMMALSGDADKERSGRWGLWGNQDEPEANTDTLHKYVWTPPELIGVLRDAGFQDISIEPAQTHDPARDFRVIAVK
jgi:predicted SAM-dependent methyltransferase